MTPCVDSTPRSSCAEQAGRDAPTYCLLPFSATAVVSASGS